MSHSSRCCIGAGRSGATERIVNTVKIKKKRETFPDIGFSSLERESNVQDNHKNQMKREHEMENYQRQNRLPKFTIDDLNQTDFNSKAIQPCEAAPEPLDW